MQRGFRKIDTWCKTKGLPLNLEKTKFVFFTCKKKTNEVVRLEYQRVKLTFTEEVKCLGVTLDDELMRKTHAENR